MDISGLPKAAVLAALYNAALPKGRGFLKYTPSPITVEEAERIIVSGDDITQEFGSLGPEYYTEYCFDYVNGRALKVDLTFDDFEFIAYNQCNGEGVAERVIDHLRKTGEVASEEILEEQNKKVLEEAFKILDNIDSEITLNFKGKTFKTGFREHAEALQEAIRRVIEELYDK